MFQNCKNLTNLELSNWKTNKVEKMGGMFYGCSSLTNLDLSKWNTHAVYGH
jgi:surface protein